MPPVPAAPGLRERNKAEKLQRIRDAARDLFVENGYDNTTMREITQRANIGFGTLFTYASDKRDLLFLVFNDDLAEVVEDATRKALKEPILLDQLIAFFRCFYRFFARQPELSRFVLRELTFYVRGKQAEIFQRSREVLLQRLTMFAAQAQADGRLATQENAETLARALFSIYAAELRDWVGADASHLDIGLARLGTMLRLVIEGFEPRTGIFAPSRRGRAMSRSKRF